VSFGWWAEERREERQAHGDDIFVAIAESLESAGMYRYTVRSEVGPLLSTRTCLCTAARAVVAAVVKPDSE